MFAVPGWSVSAESLKTQTTGVEGISTGTFKEKEADGRTARKKRKREKSKTHRPSVTSSNLADLWEQVIEGKTSKKKSRTTQEATANAVPQLHGKVASGSEASNSKDRFEARKTLKQKRREKKARLQETGELPPARPAATAGSVSIEGKENGVSRKKAKVPEMDSTAATSKTTGHQVLPATTLTPLQAKMRSKLTSARFRHLNQTLYTTPSTSSYSLFSENPDMFADYHAGFRQQVDVWPENPVDGYIEDLKMRGKVKVAGGRRDGKASRVNQPLEGETPPLPRTEGICVVADLGCGEAKIANELKSQRKKLKLDIKSYDLGSASELVTKADISALPLKDGSIDVAIFCLALMGTNWLDFVEEAYRILRWKGELWIAEIKSRFGRVQKRGRVEHSVGNRKKPGKQTKMEDDEDVDTQLAVVVDGVEDQKGETDVSAFVEVLRKRGFVLKGDEAIDKSNKMFVKLSCVKALTPTAGKGVPLDNQGAGKVESTWKMKPKMKFLDEQKGEGIDDGAVLKPCVYKLR
jgi:ribosomal RNA-processing protein 8